nr:PREDICTED: matrix-remodeling-associated protein 5-like [Lepisosteus oculatus]
MAHHWLPLAAVAMGLCAQELGTSNWNVDQPSPVNGWPGGSAALSCNFTHPPTSGPTRILWLKDRHNLYPQPDSGEVGVVVLNCTVKTLGQECSAGAGWKGRVSLEGDLQQSNGALRLRDLRLSDTGPYYCRLELLENSTRGFTFVYPRLLNVSMVEPVSIRNLSSSAGSSGAVLLMCVAGGSPVPSLTLFSPTGSTVPNLPSTSPGQLSAVLHSPVPPGNYTCVANNTAGQETRTIWLEGDTPEASHGGHSVWVYILVPLSVLVAIATSLALFLWRRKGVSGPEDSHPVMGEEHIYMNTVCKAGQLKRPQGRDLTYENTKW